LRKTPLPWQESQNTFLPPALPGKRTLLPYLNEFASACPLQEGQLTQETIATPIWKKLQKKLYELRSLELINRLLYRNGKTG